MTELANLNPKERQQLIRDIVVTHPRFADTTAAVERFHCPVAGGLPSRGTFAALFGDSRVGKSFCLDRYAKRFPKSVGPCGVAQPVVMVSMPIAGSGGPRAVLEAIAEGLNLQYSLRMTNPALMRLIVEGLRAQQVEFLILDEFDQVFRDNDRRLLVFVRGLLRKLLDQCEVSILCAGLAATYELIKSDPQLVGRGGLPYHHVASYDWKNNEDREDFMILCNQFDKALPFAQRSNLAEKNLCRRLYGATYGNIGLLKVYIEAAGAAAINDGSDRIEIEHFGAAYEQRKRPGSSFNWFRSDPSEFSLAEKQQQRERDAAASSMSKSGLANAA